jgi:threonylcarbamoyladenosine tRNA methylthiotransferase MtaB
VSVEVLNFGCRLNAAESEIIQQQTESAQLSNAVIVNTCAVTAEAVRQARQAIRRSHRERPAARIIVTGCAVQAYPQKFLELPDVALVLGNRDKISAKLWRDVADDLARTPDMRGKSYVGDIMAATDMVAPQIERFAAHTRAFVQIQTGCDHRCTFCVIPFGRGNSRSLSPDEVIAQVRRVTEAGHREVVLTGVDITSWGADLPGQPTLGQLVARILKLVPELPRLRISSIDAAEIDPDLMRCLAEEPRLMPYLHLSLQAGDDMILKRMKRRHSRVDALKLVADVRGVRPDTAFGADFIAGFPTETEEMFDNTLRLVEEAGLSFLHVFPYSPRPGTPAARMPPVQRAAVKDRAARLRAAGQAALSRHLERQVGRTLKGLVEKPGVARAEDFTEIAFEGEAAVGGVTDFVVTGHDGKRVVARLAVPEAA